jgi:hypothetical protein
MSKTVALLLALVGIAHVARAQSGSGGVGRASALLARANSLWVQLARRDSAAQQRTYGARLARRFDAGPVVVLLPGSAGTETGWRVAAGARDFLDGAIPATFVAARVAIASAATGVDSVLGMEGLAGRTRIMADIAARPDSLANGWAVAGALAGAYRETLDTTWRAWLPFDLTLGWTMRRDGNAAVRDLMGSDTRSGADCLGGSVAACRLWLGLDADTNPFRSRYRPEELRKEIGSRSFVLSYTVALARQCKAGSDEACVRAAAAGLLPAVPAGRASRGSLLAFVRAHRTAGALVTALADSSGSIGQRLARATGMPEDSLVGAWRIWLLTGGGMPRVTASVRDALPVVIFAALLLLAASWSGRWR